MLKLRYTSSNKFLLLFFLGCYLSSCVSKKDIVYFQNDAIDQEKVSNSFKTIIKPDDLLQVTITALDVEAVRPFNLTAVNYARNFKYCGGSSATANLFSRYQWRN